MFQKVESRRDSGAKFFAVSPFRTAPPDAHIPERVSGGAVFAVGSRDVERQSHPRGLLGRCSRARDMRFSDALAHVGGAIGA